MTIKLLSPGTKVVVLNGEDIRKTLKDPGTQSISAHKKDFFMFNILMLAYCGKELTLKRSIRNKVWEVEENLFLWHEDWLKN